GVVLRGEGMGDTGTILIGTGTGRSAVPGGGGPGGAPQGALIVVGGASGVTPNEDTKQVVTDEYVPVGSRTLRVMSARGFRPGDTVIVRRVGNQGSIAAAGMHGRTPATP